MPGHEICPYLSRKPRASQCRSDQVSSRCPAVAITGTRPFTAQHNLEPSKSVFACSRACLHLCLVFSALCPSCLTSFSATALDLGILPRDAVFVGSCMSGNVVTLVLRLGFEGVTLENRLAALVDQASALHVGTCRRYLQLHWPFLRPAPHIYRSFRIHPSRRYGQGQLLPATRSRLSLQYKNLSTKHISSRGGETPFVLSCLSAGWEPALIAPREAPTTCRTNRSITVRTRQTWAETYLPYLRDDGLKMSRYPHFLPHPGRLAINHTWSRHVHGPLPKVAMESLRHYQVHNW